MSSKQTIEEIEHHLHSYERWMEPAAATSGTELVTNGGFDADASWTKSAATISGGQAHVQTNGLLSQASIPANSSGVNYTLTAQVYNYPIYLYVKSIEAVPINLFAGFLAVGASSVSFTTINTAGVDILFDGGGLAGTVDIDNVSIMVTAGSHYADRAGSRKTSAVSFQLDAGNNEWGVWVPLLGSLDTPVVPNKAYFDLHRLGFIAAERNALYIIQIAFGTSLAQALVDNAYSSVYYRPTNTGGEAFAVQIQCDRHPAGDKVWARCICPGQNTATVDFIYGLHEYSANSTGYVESTVNDIANNAITAASIADNAIDAGAIAADAITNAKIADNAIAAENIANDAITAAKIADGAIDAATFAANAISATAIASNAIAAAKIATGAITSAKFAAGAIDAAAIANAAIDIATFAADVKTGNNLNCESKVTAAPTDMALASKLLAYVQALARKDVSAPVDMGGTYNPSLFSLEAQTIANAAEFGNILESESTILDNIAEGFSDITGTGFVKDTDSLVNHTAALTGLGETVTAIDSKTTNLPAAAEMPTKLLSDLRTIMDGIDDEQTGDIE